MGAEKDQHFDYFQTNSIPMLNFRETTKNSFKYDEK